MEREEFYSMLAEITGEEPSAIVGSTELKSMEGWDSLAVVQLIATADERFGVTLPAKQITTCTTVQDLINLLGNRIN